MKSEEIRDLLPSYVAGALSAEQSKRVEASLEDDPGLKQELAEWRVLRAGVADVSTEEPAFRPELIEDVHRRIDAYEEGLKAARLKPGLQRTTETTGSTGTIETWVEKIFGLWEATPFAAQVAVAAQFAALAVLITVVSIGPSGDSGFTTASGGTAGAADGRSVTVVFQPGATLDEVRVLLEQTGAQIVAGPSGQGAYSLNLGDIDDAEVASLLETLRSNDAVVRFAAPVE
jgi:anti-sigma factor RsiW